MRRLLIIAGLVLSGGLLQAQRGGGHAAAGGGHAGFGGGAITSGGFASRGFSSGGAAPPRAFSRVSPGFRAPAHASLTPGSRYQQGLANQTGNWTSAGFFPSHSGQVLNRNGRRNGRVGYGIYGYPYIGYPAFSYGDIFDNGDYDDPNLQGSGGGGGGQYLADYGGPAQGQDEPGGPAGDAEYPYGRPNAARAPYGSAGAPSDYGSQDSGQPGGNGLQHPGVTLVFKDGHKLKVQNYALTQTKILVTDNSTERDIPLSTLDARATTAANDAAGVDFPLPGAAQ